jgi:hypothetical protein
MDDGELRKMKQEILAKSVGVLYFYWASTAVTLKK